MTLYAIGLLEEDDQRGGLFKKPPSKKAKDDLLKFAEITGGQAFFPKNLDEVEEHRQSTSPTTSGITTPSRYTPTNAKLDGSWREVTRKDQSAQRTCRKITWNTKQGYYAPKADAVSSNQ